MTFTVLKADGSTEFFKAEKLRRSLRRAGATSREVYDIMQTVEQRLFDGIRTQEIYRLAFDLLRDAGMPAATRYSLRRALLGLGPTGFPFEQFLGRLFTAHGYQTKTGITLEGHCATHEIDVAAYNPTHSFIAEAKFHARPGIKTDLQVAMYSYARLLDLRDQQICQDDICGVKDFWLITNTKFTTAAERYANCTGLKLLSWDYPRKDNLHDRIQRTGIYPITVLQSLSHQHISQLIRQGAILCADLVAKPHTLRSLHLTKAKHDAVIAEATSIMTTHEERVSAQKGNDVNITS